MANLMKQTEERHSESRMREIRPSGSMRGKDVGGHWPCAFHPVASFPTLLKKSMALSRRGNHEIRALTAVTQQIGKQQHEQEK